MILNIVNGKPKVAKITVNTKASASVTCVLSPYSLSATANSSGVAEFWVPKIGTWAVTASYGGVSKSSNVSIDSYNGNKSVTINLEMYLITNGARTVNWTNSTSTHGGSITDESGDIRLYVTGGGSVDYNVSATLTLSSAVSFTGYTKINVEYTTTISGHEHKSNVGYSTSQSSGYTNTTFPVTSTKTTETIDISSLSGNYYIRISTSIPSTETVSSSTVTKIYNVWLS